MGSGCLFLFSPGLYGIAGNLEYGVFVWLLVGERIDASREALQ